MFYDIELNIDSIKLAKVLTYLYEKSISYVVVAYKPSRLSIHWRRESYNYTLMLSMHELASRAVQT